jgi:hypothetical protein
MHGVVINADKDLVVKREGKRQLWKPRCRREDDIEVNHKEISVRSWTTLNWLRIVFRRWLF